MKHLLILLSLLILSLPLLAQETGALYFKKVNGKYGWFENGNDKKDWKYIGEIKNGKPNGTGVLSSTSGKYSGELKNGIKHGQGTYTYKSGRKRVGEFRKGKPWNVKSYDKKGKIETEWVKGKKLEKEEVTLEEKDHTENESYKIGIRVLLGNTSGKASTSNTSLSLIWENYGLGFNQMSFKTTSSKNNSASGMPQRLMVCFSVPTTKPLGSILATGSCSKMNAPIPRSTPSSSSTRAKMT